jgi:uncharacterized SAM-binding protein YcdF (DUF218 family)
MKRWALSIGLAWVVLVMIPTIPAVRAFMASPLVITDAQARGDACYVLASGDAFTERLSAASDLYHMGRISRIIFQRSDEWTSYNFIARKSFTPTDWSLEFLKNRGIPADRIIVIPKTPGTFGTLSEARNMKKLLPPATKRLVLVSSAPHMRRVMLTFRRVFRGNTELIPYAASDFLSSAENYRPIWLEYSKLAVYSVVARP